MQTIEIERRIEKDFSSVDMDIEGADCSFSITIVSDDFSGLSTLARQQKVLTLFKSELGSGKLHALTIKAFTYEEWNAKSSSLVQLDM